MTATATRRRFTVTEYYEMARVGILRPGDRVELIRGEIIAMSPIGDRHAGCVDFLTAGFCAALGAGAVVRIQGPVRLGPESEPQPDVAILRPRADFYRHGHPGPADVLLIVEVSDTTREHDRDVKIPDYGEAGIPEAWRVDLVEEVIEVYRRPGPGGYHEVRRYRRGESVSCLAFPVCVFRVEDILG